MKAAEIRKLALLAAIGYVALNLFGAVKKTFSNTVGNVTDGQTGPAATAPFDNIEGTELGGRIQNVENYGTHDTIDFVICNWSDHAIKFSAYVEVSQGGLTYPVADTAKSKVLVDTLPAYTWKEYHASTDGVIGLPLYGTAHLFINGVEVASES